MIAAVALVVLSTSFADQLADAKRRYVALEYDQALAAVQRLTSAPEVPTPIMIEALALEGAVLAITKDLTDAERPFRRLLRLEPAYELPPKSPPKIVAAFRRVQADERALAADAERSRRAAIVAHLKLLDGLPTEARGGRPLELRLRLYDPDGAVAKVSVPYRRAGESVYSVLALARDPLGQWAGTLPGDYTASPDGFTLEYFWQTTDAGGAPLLAGGSERAPLALAVAAGSGPRPLPRAVFAGTAAATVLSGLAFGALAISLHDTQAYLQHRETSAEGIDAAQAVELKHSGVTLASWTTAAAITSCVLLAATIVVALLTEW